LLAVVNFNKMLDVNYTIELYKEKYGENAVKYCKKQIENSLTTKAETHWNKVLDGLNS
tara:strand:- start:5 stop:178 length:174 start_codon:yes stop_codon:yes gene_type:complete